MSTNVIMPALGMAQETGRLVRWLKREGETVQQGEPLMEVETDKATVEIEAPASGMLCQVAAVEGADIPVGQVIARIVSPAEAAEQAGPLAPAGATSVFITPVARKVAAEHRLDLAEVRPQGGRIDKADVLAHLGGKTTAGAAPRVVLASPKARRLAKERGIELASLTGSGERGAVLAADVPAAGQAAPARAATSAQTPQVASSQDAGLSNVWRIMVERVSASWTSVPHFYLTRQVRAAALVELRNQIAPVVERRRGVKPTYTDLLVKVIAWALRDHPRLNASWAGQRIETHAAIGIGIATATEEGLVVPVIHQADELGIGAIATRRQDLVTRAAQNRLRPDDLAGGTFTLTNLGMHGVDAFNAIVNAPQAAILAVGRIADQVVPENGLPVVHPMMMLTLSCDHRVVDGARGAAFLGDLAGALEHPWELLA